MFSSWLQSHLESSEGEVCLHNFYSRFEKQATGQQNGLTSYMDRLAGSMRTSRHMWNSKALEGTYKWQFQSSEDRFQNL